MSRIQKKLFCNLLEALHKLFSFNSLFYFFVGVAIAMRNNNHLSLINFEVKTSLSETFFLNELGVRY